MPGTTLHISNQPPEPNYGGQDHPYPDSVPFCAPGQYLNRAILSPRPDAPGKTALAFLDATFPLRDSYIDPRDVDIVGVLRFLPRDQYTGICQHRILTTPQRFALFGVLLPAPAEEPLSGMLGEMTGSDKPADFKTLTEMGENINQYMPEHLRRCVNLETQDQQEVVTGDYLSYYSDESTDLAVSLMRELSFFDLDENRWNFFVNIVDFALFHDVPEFEVRRIAHALPQFDTNAEEFLYLFATIVSLSVGRVLDWENRANGGLIPGYDDFANSVESAITSGLVGARVMTAGEWMQSGGSAIAQYDGFVENVIRAPSLTDNSTMEMLFGTLLHESMHVYQDIKEDMISKLEGEWQADYLSDSAEMLIGIHADDAGSVLSARIASEREDSAVSRGIDRSYLECLGAYRLLQDDDEFRDEIDFAYELYLTSLWMELTGTADVSSKGFYQEYKMLMEYSGTLAEFRGSSSLYILDQYVAGELNEASLDSNEEKRFSADLREAMYAAPVNSGKRIMAAGDYLHNYAWISLLAEYFDLEFLDETADLMSREDKETAARALMSEGYFYDGI